jgi:hypothetical protein
MFVDRGILPQMRHKPKANPLHSWPKWCNGVAKANENYYHSRFMPTQQ